MARICVIRQGFFPLDTRVRREVGALAAAGHEVDVVCVRRPGERRRERQGSVRIHRLALPLKRAGRLQYVLQYAVFLAVAGLYATLLAVRRRFDLVQVNSIPDVLVFAATGPRLLGARVLLDLHECMPEFTATKYGLGMRHPLVRAMAILEQASIRFADATITCTEQMREAFVARGARPDGISVVLNSSDEEIFDADRFAPGDREQRGFTLLTHGAMEERYGLDTLIEATALLGEEMPDLRVELYGEGSERDELERLAARLGVAGRVRFSDGFVPIDDLVRAIAEADAGVVAIRRDVFRDLTHCNKMFDFIAMRRPAIVSRTRSVEAYFDEDCFVLFDDGDAADLARAIRALRTDPSLADRLVRRAAEVAEPYRWVHQRRLYQGIVASLAGRSRRSPAARGDAVRAPSRLPSS
jgi:glycosyltransferase involved in cell wall biosynthesis